MEELKNKYAAQLQPLMNALADACEELDVPYVTMIQLDENRKVANLSGESIVMGSYHIVEDAENIATPIADAIQHMLPEDDTTMKPIPEKHLLN